MRSESLARLDDHDDIGATYSERKRQDRLRIARETEEFLAGGGKIRELDSFSGARPTYGFNLGPVVESITGVVRSVPPREGVDGVVLVTIARVSRMVKLSTTNINVKSTDGRFPKPVTRKPRLRWREEDVLEWVKSNG